MKIPLCEGRKLPNELETKYLKLHLQEQFENLSFNSQSIDKYQTMPNVLAFDTETYTNGDLLTICTSEGDHLEFKKGDYDLFSIYQFFKKHLNKNTIFFAWNLGFDATIILKHLKDDIINFKKSEYHLYYDAFNIHYIPKKCLSISDKSKHSLVMYDIASLFNKMPLDDAAKKFLNNEKKYDGKYQDKKFPDDILKDKKELNKVIKYCVHDAILTRDLSKFWINNFYKSFKIYPKKYHSAGTIAIQYLKTQLETWNSFFKIPYEIQKLAFESYFGGRFEVFKRGTFTNVFHYDINSAYPYAMALMPDFTNGYWITLKSIKEFDPSILKYVGFFKINVKVNEKVISPFLFRPVRSSAIYAPNGHFKTFTTSKELQIALKYYDIDLIDIEGYYFIPFEDQYLKFNKIVKEMYKQRLNQKDEGQKAVYRIIINSLYGKTAQIKPIATNFFSPVVCSYITGFCRAMLLDSVKNHKNSIIAFATDAIFSETPLNLPISKNKKLGEYSFEFHRDFTIFMSGIYSFNYWGHKDREWNRQTRSRGFKIKCLRADNTTYKLDLTSENIIEDKKRNKFLIKINYILPNTISASIASHNIKEIGKMTKREKEIDLNGDHKRLWFEVFKNLESKQDSNCLPVKLLI